MNFRFGIVGLLFLAACGGKIRDDSQTITVRDGSSSSSGGSSSGSSNGSSSGSASGKPGEVASALDAPANLVVANDTIFFSDGQKLLSCPTSGCGYRPNRLALVDSYIQSVATSGVEVFFTDAEQTVYAIPLAGGSVRKVATGLAQPRGLAVSNGALYWVTFDGSVQRCTFGCGEGPQTITAGEVGHPYALAIVGNDLFWTTEGASHHTGQVRTCTDGLCNPRTLAEGQNYARAIVANEKLVYWIADGDSTVRHCALPGCSQIDELPLAGQTGLAIDSSRVYWSYFTSGWVESCTLGDCNTPTPVAQQLEGPGSIAIDGNNVYVATAGWSGTDTYQPRVASIITRAK